MAVQNFGHLCPGALYIYVVTNEEILFNARRVGEDEATQTLHSPLRNSKKSKISECSV